MSMSKGSLLRLYRLFNKGYGVDRSYGQLKEWGYLVSYEDIAAVYIDWRSKMKNTKEKVSVRFDVNTRHGINPNEYTYNAAPGLKPNDIVIVETQYGPSLARVTKVGDAITGIASRVEPSSYVLAKVDIKSLASDIREYMAKVYENEARDQKRRDIINKIDALSLLRNKTYNRVSEIQDDIDRLVEELDSL